jgi:hypothetical protein
MLNERIRLLYSPSSRNCRLDKLRVRRSLIRRVSFVASHPVYIKSCGRLAAVDLLLPPGLWRGFLEDASIRQLC